MTVSDAVPTHEVCMFPSRSHGEVALTLDNTRDGKLTDFGLATVAERYLLPGETPQKMFGRVAAYFSKNKAHAQRLYDAISKLWFMPATPVLSNGGTNRGNPISCFLNAVPDTMTGIADTWRENVDLASQGGGIGTYWGDVRSKGELIKDRGKTTGVVPFIKVMDSLTLAVSQGSLRRGSAATYLDIHHPEIEEFIEIRRPTGGDPNRRCLNIHHGIMITDAFMEAVVAGKDFDLISPKDGAVVKTVAARDLWVRILTARLETGEPYLVFSDTVNRKLPAVYQALGLKVKQSNLCSEIALHTGLDHLNFDRTAVCCLSSLVLETYREWEGNEEFIEDCLLFLDEVIEDFIVRTEGIPGFEKARYAAIRGRDIGLGVMGWHSLLQSEGIQFDGLRARELNKTIFSWLFEVGNRANHQAALDFGPNPDSKDARAKDGSAPDLYVRWNNWSAIAPTASISIIAGGSAPGVEPWPANSFIQKTLTGTFAVKNRYLAKLIRSYAAKHEPDCPATQDEFIANAWSSITANGGSVQHLEFLTEDEKALYRTAWELPQMAVIQLAADRAPFITQMASNNVFIRPDVSKAELNKLHVAAWRLGVPSLYYLRSLSIQRATNVTHVAGEMPQARPPHEVALIDRGEALAAPSDPEVCEACQ